MKTKSTGDKRLPDHGVQTRLPFQTPFKLPLRWNALQEHAFEGFLEKPGHSKIVGCAEWLVKASRPSGWGTILGAGVEVLSAKKTDYFKQLLETRIAELERLLVTTEREVRASGAKHADPADQAASEYERQSLAHKAASVRQTLKALKEALSALQKGKFGECAECGGDIELKRLEAIPWARYCLKCQEARE